MKILVYVTSLIFSVIPIVLIIEYPNSGRMQLIVGGLVFIGFALNIARFSLSKDVKVLSN
jgi:hypothetical protein